MDSSVRTVIERIHDTPTHLVLVMTGGGTGASHWLLSVPGASRTILETVVPYHEQALVDFLAHRPTSFCSKSTASQMARRAWERARWLAPDVRVLGVSCTAGLKTDRPKRGDHRFHLAIFDGKRCSTRSLILTKDARAREDEEDVLDRVLLNFLAEAMGVSERVDVPLLENEHLQREGDENPTLFSQFFVGAIPTVCIEPDGRCRSDAGLPKLLLCGSFNPLHRGHLELADTASQMLGEPFALEMTVINADKPAIAEEEVHRRLEDIAWRAAVWLTNAPTFLEKARLFPGLTFLVGADTAERLVQQRFYDDDARTMAKAFAEIEQLGCRFLVAGRRNEEGTFQTLDDIDIPDAFRGLFASIPEEKFRRDVSSTEIRESE